MKILFSLLALFLITAEAAPAMPARVLLIRHGEKPTTGNQLNAQGQARAHALVSFFKDNPDVNAFGPLVAIYAMAPNDAQGSIRAIQTVAPTSQALQLPLQDRFKKKDVEALVNEIEKNPADDGRTVLICWEHDYIPKIAKAFGLKNAPKWPGSDVFDRMWMLTFQADGSIAFQDIGEQVLPGDSP